MAKTMVDGWVIMTDWFEAGRIGIVTDDFLAMHNTYVVKKEHAYVVIWNGNELGQNHRDIGEAYTVAFMYVSEAIKNG